jgi:hypothetical protein
MYMMAVAMRSLLDAYEWRMTCTTRAMLLKAINLRHSGVGFEWHTHVLGIVTQEQSV